MMRKMLLATLSVALSACMSAPHVPPATGLTAELIVARADGSTGARLFIALLDGAECKDARSLERLDFDSDEQRRTTIVAGRRTQLVLSEYRRESSGQCRVATDFDVVAGGRYRAIWSAAGDRCFVRLETLTTVDGKETYRTEPSAKLNYKNC